MCAKECGVVLGEKLTEGENVYVIFELNIKMGIN